LDCGAIIWDLTLVDGERYHARKSFVKKGDEVIKIRTLYDWKGKVRPWVLWPTETTFQKERGGKSRGL
jgi:hypothetical protein